MSFAGPFSTSMTVPSAAPFLLDAQADQLEDVVGVLARLGQIVAVDGERGAARDGTVELDHRDDRGAALRDRDLGRGAVDEERRALQNRSGRVARALDEKEPSTPWGPTRPTVTKSSLTFLARRSRCEDGGTVRTYGPPASPARRAS